MKAMIEFLKPGAGIVLTLAALVVGGTFGAIGLVGLLRAASHALVWALA